MGNFSIITNNEVKITEDGVGIKYAILRENDSYMKVLQGNNGEVILEASKITFDAGGAPYETVSNKLAPFTIKNIFIAVGGHIKRNSIVIGEGENEKTIDTLETKGVYYNYDNTDTDSEFAKLAAGAFKSYEEINNKRLSKLITNSADPERWAIEFSYNALG